MLRPLAFYLNLGISHNFPRKMRPNMVVPQEETGDDLPTSPWLVLGGHLLSPPGGPTYLVSFSLENCDQTSVSVVSTVYYASNFFILPQLRLGKIQKLLA